MSLAHDLLQQSRHLAELDPTRPRQASLKRGISTAYYAFFHLLVGEASRRLAPRPEPALVHQIGRAFQHGEMKEACNWLVRLSGPFTPGTVLNLHPNVALVHVAQTFIGLQDARHRADYDAGAIFSRAQTLAYVEDTELAFRNWRAVRSTRESDIFLAALAFGKRWSR